MRNIVILAVIAGVACKKNGGGDDETYTITAQPLQGTINGEDWDFVIGGTDAFLSEGEDDFFTSLYGEDVDVCNFGSSEGPSLIVQLPKEPGSYEMSFANNATFVVDGSDNFIATKGTVRVDEVTETTVTGGVHMIYPDDGEFAGEVDGEFEVEICPS
jgi:hypothetical protein